MSSYMYNHYLKKDRINIYVHKIMKMNLKYAPKLKHIVSC